MICRPTIAVNALSGVHSSWYESDCKFDEPTMVTTLRECNNSVMDVSKDEWEKKPNNCSAPVIKQVVDYMPSKALAFYMTFVICREIPNKKIAMVGFSTT